jgi:SAM-dependent methyltransferase
MAEPLLRALARMRALILDDQVLVRAVASGQQRGQEARWRRVELRYVDLKAGRHLQVTAYDATQAHTSNHAAGAAARDAVDALLDEPFANWHVETTTQQHQVRVTKKLEALVHTTDRAAAVEPERSHDKAKERLLPEDDPVLVALGISGKDGRIKPSRQAKYRQVEEFLRLLDASITEALASGLFGKSGKLRRPTKDEPLRIVDLGCGNAYLTFAAQAHLSRSLPVHLTGVDVKQQSSDHNTKVAAELGLDMDFVVGTIAEATLDRAPDVVLALHACDTATDEALARAIGWEAGLVLAAPCCHHDIAAQLRRSPTPAPYSMLTRHGILRERFADTLTDALRASILRLQGYRVDVVEFVESEHTPRNTLLRAVRTGGAVKGGSVRKEYDELVASWAVRPKLADLLEDPGA